MVASYCIFMFYLIGTSLVTCLQSVDLKSLITAYVIIKPPDLHLDSIFFAVNITVHCKLMSSMWIEIMLSY